MAGVCAKVDMEHIRCEAEFEYTRTMIEGTEDRFGLYGTRTDEGAT